jgi:hypothetical protein
VLAHLLLGQAYELKGMYAESMEESLAVHARDQSQWVPALRKADATAGWRGYGWKVVNLRSDPRFDDLKRRVGRPP